MNIEWLIGKEVQFETYMSEIVQGTVVGGWVDYDQGDQDGESILVLMLGKKTSEGWTVKQCAVQHRKEIMVFR